MRPNRFFLIRTFALFLFSAIFLMPAHSSEELINEFFNLRMKLCLESTPEAALSKINAFIDEYSSEFDECSDEEKLALKNLYALEKFNYMNLLEPKSSSVKKMIQERQKENENWIQSHKGKVFDKWFITTSADVTSVFMSFDPLQYALKYGLVVKLYYEEALTSDPEFSYALMNLGQWYYFAPMFAGGRKSKGKKLFIKAKECAKTDAEKYYSLIFLSQIAFDEKDKAKCQAYLSEAEVYCPGGSFIQWLRSINEKGYSYFTNSSNKYE